MESVHVQHTGEGRSSLVKFIESLRFNKRFETYRDKVRVVPRGLFVDERVAEAVVSEFQEWLLKASAGEANKTTEKTRQWLFEGHQPERLYVVEGKSVLAGYLIPAGIANPQQYGLPYYLGSLLSTASYLHPADPQLHDVPGLELRQGKFGIEALVTRRRKQIVIPENSIRSFQAIAQGSRFLQRRYPGVEKSLVVCTQSLAGLARRARSLPKTFPIVVPFDVKTSKTRELSAAGKFLFVEEKGVIVRILELNGRNLSSFLRDELGRAPREKLGSFRLLTKHRDLLGFYEISGHRTSIHARAFSEFEELIRRTRENREKFSGWFTAAECFEKFSSIYQLSQPIERGKIAGALARFGIEGSRFRINGGWIFAISSDNTVMRTVAKHIRLPGHRRG